jgi:hypothetical protein
VRPLFVRAIRPASHVEMLHDRRQLERQRTREFRHRQAGLTLETRKDGAPRGVDEGGKRTIELTDRTLHHVVNYRR